MMAFAAFRGGNPQERRLFGMVQEAVQEVGLAFREIQDLNAQEAETNTGLDAQKNFFLAVEHLGIAVQAAGEWMFSGQEDGDDT